MSWYCEVAPGDEVHRPYHDHEYGFPTTDERVLCERLALEIFQAGLSWRLVLQKRPALAAALANFEPDRLAAFGADDLNRLLADRTIIRNRRKLEAIVNNARCVLDMRRTHDGFHGWLAAHQPLTEEAWLALFRQTFRFMGREVVREFLMSIGELPGAHHPQCPIYPKVLAARPRWMVSRAAPDRPLAGS